MRHARRVILEFGEYVLVPRERTLTRHGRPLSLSGKPYDLLCLLAEHAGELVSSSEIHAALWTDVAVGASSLPVAIAAVRAALGSDAHLVETVRGAGYRLACCVAERPLFPVHREPDVLTTVTAERVHELSRQGRLLRERHTLPSLERSIACFERAIALAPALAAPYVGLADAYALLGAFETAIFAPREVLPKATRAIETALSLEPAMPEALASAGALTFMLHRSVGAAESQLREAIRLAPGCATAYRWLAQVLVASQRSAEAVEMAATACALEPLVPIFPVTSACIHWLAGTASEAVGIAERATLLHPAFGPAWGMLGQCLEAVGRPVDALQAHRRAVRLAKRPAAAARGFLAHALARAGHGVEARALCDAVAAERGAYWIAPYPLAVACAGLGDIEGALHYLRVALQEQDPWLVYVKIDPRLESVRRSPAFTTLSHRLGPFR